MSIDSLGYVGYYNAPSYAVRNYGVRTVTPVQEEILFSRRNIDPYKDKVYIDPKTGEYTTWKPGIIQPKKESNSSNIILGLLGALGALLLAIAFRGRIKGGIAEFLKAIKAYIPKGVKGFAKNIIDYALNLYKTAKTYIPVGVKKVVKSTYTTVVSFVDKGKIFVNDVIVKPIKTMFKGLSTPAT